MLTEKLSRNTSSIDVVRDDYKIVARLEKLYQRFMDGDDSPQLEKFINDQKKILDKVKEKIDSELEVDNVVI